MNKHSLKQALLESVQPDGIISGKILVGANLTLVQGRHWGIASTLTQQAVLANFIENPGALASSSILEIIKKLNSERLLEASLGMAALNSVLDAPETCEIADAYAEIAKRSIGKNVAVIGHFPFVDRLSKIARNCWVFERKLRDGDISAERMPELIPDAEVLVMTAQTIPNNTFDFIMGLAPRAFKFMLGPSTPMSPVLFDFGIDVLGGVRILKPKEVYELVAQGAHFKQLTGMQKLILKR